jgi:hypothetical protein
VTHASVQSDLDDKELQEHLTAIGQITESQYDEGWTPVVIVFGNGKGQWRSFQSDDVGDVAELFRSLADSDWFEEDMR